MVNEKRLIDANELLAIGHKTKLIEVFPEWKELPLSAQKAVCKYAGFWKKMIQQLPTVDAVEVVHGRWLFDSNTERYFCSACNEFALCTSKDVPQFDYDWEENLRYSYTETIYEEHLTKCCPNCGAKMDGGADNGG